MNIHTPSPLVQKLFVAWLIVEAFLFPFSPLQFRNLSVDYFRFWMFELISPSVLCVFAFPYFASPNLNRNVKVSVLIVVLPIFLWATGVAVLDSVGAMYAVTKHENYYCQVRQTINAGASSVVTSGSGSSVQTYLEVRQEWPLGSVFKIVRYIDRFQNLDKNFKVTLVEPKTIRYEGDPKVAGKTRKLW